VSLLEILLDNREGKLWDISSITSDLSWKTKRIGSPASIDFSLMDNGIYQDKAFMISNGDIVRVKRNGSNLFYGYVFSIKGDHDGEVSVKAYDQVRYLLAKDTYKFKGATAGAIIKKIAGDFGLKIGRIDDTRYSIPSMLEPDKTLIDIIEKSITLTIHNTQRHYVFFDDFGSLSLRLVNDFLAGFYIGDGSLMTGYDYARDIDSDTYNKIKLYKENKETGRREVHIAQDSTNIAKWGLLQLYQSVDEKMNDAQIDNMLTQLSQLKNRETRSLKLDAIGDVRVRAGTYVPIIIEALGLKQPMLVDEVNHKFDGDNHTMTLNLKVI
jgi:hypothetical protein